MTNKNKNITDFLFATLPYLLLFTLAFSVLFGIGINFDGTLYATIARNLTLSNGSIWQLPLNLNNPVYFYEHLPFGFVIESFFFRLFGDHRYTENIYIVSTGIVLVFLIGKTWTILTKKPNLHWAPQLFLVLCPTFFSVVKSNWLETPAFIFSCLSIFYTVKMYESTNDTKKNGHQFSDYWRLIGYPLLAGFFTLSAILIKPPVPLALFCITALLYFCYGMHLKLSRLVTFGVCYILPSLMFVLYVLYFNPIAKNFLQVYLQNQLFASLQGRREISSPYFHVFKNFTDFLIPLGVFLVLFLYARIRKIKITWDKKAVIFLLCALILSLPCAISPKNFARYLVISYLFYGFFFCYILQNLLSESQSNIEKKSFNNIFMYTYITALIVGIGFSVSKIGKIIKKNQIDYFSCFTNQKMPSDLKTLFILADDPIYSNPEFRANFIRDYPYVNMQLTQNKNIGKYYLYNTLDKTIPKNCVSISINRTSKYQIFDCSERLN